MPEIDLEPKDYRAEPLKGEPVFAPGGLLRLGVYAGVVALGLVIAIIASPIYWWVSGWLRSL